MIILSTTSDVLRLITASANAVDVHCSYVDNSDTVYSPGRQNTVVTTATTITVLAAPAGSTQRQLKKAMVHARGGANTVTVEFYDGTTAYRGLEVALAAGEFLEYEDAEGWRVHDASGAIKQTPNVGIVGTAAASVVSETAFGQAAVVGVSTNYARQDHTHGTPAAPAGTTPAVSVTSETAYGVAAAVGVSTNFARQDHTHGTPSTPVTAAVAGTGIGVSAATGSVTISNSGVISVTAGTNVTLGGTSANPIINASGGGGGTPATTVVSETAYGQASAVGVATNYAREDHTHGTPASTALTPASTVVAETAFGAASAVGSSLLYARQDHTHGTPAAPSVPTASGTVASETTYGIAASAGAAATFARGDHTHGTPATPVLSVTAGTNVTLGGTAANPIINASGGGGGTPATTVTAMDTFGLASVVGTATNYAREDHRHSTQAEPVTSVTSGNAGVSFSTSTGATTLYSFGNLLKTTHFTSGTTFALHADTRWIIVRGVGGGGGGGGVANTAAANIAVASGGASGGYVEKLFLVPGGGAGSPTYTIGGAGTAGSSAGGAGGAGGNSTFTYNAATVTAFGGGGGGFLAGGTGAGTSTAGPLGALSTNGDLNGTGISGDNGIRFSGTAGLSGKGGASIMCGGGGGARSSQGAGNAATASGGGGGGALSTNAGGAAAGGAGFAGRWIVEEYC